MTDTKLPVGSYHELKIDHPDFPSGRTLHLEYQKVDPDRIEENEDGGITLYFGKTTHHPRMPQFHSYGHLQPTTFTLNAEQAAKWKAGHAEWLKTNPLPKFELVKIPK